MQKNYLINKYPHNGKLSADKSSPEEIKSIAQMVKKVFKKAVGNLYKRRLISLKNDDIYLKIKI